MMYMFLVHNSQVTTKCWGLFENVIMIHPYYEIDFDILVKLYVTFLLLQLIVNYCRHCTSHKFLTEHHLF